MCVCIQTMLSGIFKYFVCLEIRVSLHGPGWPLPPFLLSFQGAGITGMCDHSRLQFNVFMLLAA